jgi:hypothetical protein
MYIDKKSRKMNHLTAMFKNSIAGLRGHGILSPRWMVMRWPYFFEDAWHEKQDDVRGDRTRQSTRHCTGRG